MSVLLLALMEWNKLLPLGVGLAPDSPYLWSEGKIPYEVSEEINAADRAVIYDALRLLNERTPLTFRPRKLNPDYIFFRYSQSDNAKEMNSGGGSAVGMRKGKQDIYLQKPVLLTTVLHELFHAMGTLHEQQRWDRNEHLFVDDTAQGETTTVQQLFDFNVGQAVKPGVGFRIYTPYDPNSTMQYSAEAFAKPGKQTIVSRGTLAIPLIRESNYPSVGDFFTIRSMYAQMLSQWPQPPHLVCGELTAPSRELPGFSLKVTGGDTTFSFVIRPVDPHNYPVFDDKDTGQWCAWGHKVHRIGNSNSYLFWTAGIAAQAALAPSARHRAFSVQPQGPEEGVYQRDAATCRLEVAKVGVAERSRRRLTLKNPPQSDPACGAAFELSFECAVIAPRDPMTPPETHCYLPDVPRQRQWDYHVSVASDVDFWVRSGGKWAHFQFQ